MTKAIKALVRTLIRSFQAYKPPEDLTVSQWAERYRVLSSESSAEAGPWNNSRTPYLTEIMDAFTDPAVKWLTLVASSQVGKSELELNIIGYIMDQDPGSILYIQPNLDDAKKFSKLRIAPMLRDCACLRGKVADVKSRDSGNTMLQKAFTGGMLFIVGSNSPSALASIPARYIIGDERDRWAQSAGSEGDPWALAEARTTTFYNAKKVDVSTPTIKGSSKIEQSFDDGTRERWCHQCPDCGAWHNIVFNDIRFDFDTVTSGKKKDYTVKSILWCCPSCGCAATEETMRRQPAMWIAENPSALARGHRSFWLNAFSSPWQSWEKVAYAFLAAKEDPQKLKVVYNTMLGELWEDRGDLEDEDSLLDRREAYGVRPDGSPVEVPDEALVLTCGVDTQDDRLEYEVVGHGRYGETWGIKKGMLIGDPGDEPVWQSLDDVLAHVYRRRDGLGLTISLTCVDSGGHKTQAVYTQCRRRQGNRVFAIKGVGGDGVPFTKPPTKLKQMSGGRSVGNVWLYSIGVDAGKADIMGGLKVQSPGPKYCHFPREPEKGYDHGYFAGLLSERLILKTERGRTRWAWVKLPGHERNEALDCRNYALAALRILSPDMDAVENRLRDKPEERKPAARPTKRPIPRREEEDW